MLFAMIAFFVLASRVEAQHGWGTHPSHSHWSQFWEQYGGGDTSTHSGTETYASTETTTTYPDSGTATQEGGQTPDQGTGTQDSGTRNGGGETPAQGSGEQDPGTQNGGGETPPQGTGTQDPNTGSEQPGTQDPNTGSEQPGTQDPNTGSEQPGTQDPNTGSEEPGAPDQGAQNTGETSLQGGWRTGRATMYWGIHYGSCGYGDLDQNRNTGWNIAAIPTSHPDYHGSCGACYEVKCEPMNFQDGYGNTHERMEACYDPNKSVIVAITDSCPCSSNQQWCCGDMEHLDLSTYAYDLLAERKWGVIGLKYREVACPDPSYLERKDHYPPNGRRLKSENAHATLDDADSKIMNAGFTKNRPLMA